MSRRPSLLVPLAIFSLLLDSHGFAGDRDGDSAAVPGAHGHWSFQLISRPDLPAQQDPLWAINPIDRFVGRSLGDAGLPLPREASRETLIRRVTYDLTGLPPTPEQVREFLGDRSPHAWERLVDRLLDSPHYGEKWARHWLDLVRYAETNSFERDGAKPYVWRYRDYLIRAFQDDKPFDRFLVEQLAGDELEEATPDAIIATGFYRLGQWDDEPADPAQAEFDALDDIVTITGQTFLGLTVNCARCHDHKLEPIPQADYYRLLAYFRNIRHYGVRSHESVVDASVRTLASAGEQAQHADLIAAHTREVAHADSRLRQIEALVTADFVPVERDEFQHENARVALIEKRVGSLIDRETAAEYAEQTRRRDQLRRSPPAMLKATLAVKEVGPDPIPTHVLGRGSPHAPGDEVDPGLPSVLHQSPPSITPPADGESTGRRLALARWMVSDRNPLTARVMANRIWQHHFGRGIVQTPNDFGVAGSRPTHPALLDWLACELRDSGWSVKHLHRVILNSQTYRMTSTPIDLAKRTDPQNALFSRFNMRRLTSEEVRDSILAVSHQLNRARFGPSVYPEIPAEVLAGQSRPGEGWPTSNDRDQRRRSVYVHIKRSLPLPILAAFDMADSDAACPVRFATSQPTQSLTLLNSSFLQEQARFLSESVGPFAADSASDDPSDPGRRDQVIEILWRVTQRAPQDDEVKRALTFLDDLQIHDGMAADLALQTFALLALNLNEFLYLD